jgi:hypothetical protein
MMPFLPTDTKRQNLKKTLTFNKINIMRQHYQLLLLLVIPAMVLTTKVKAQDQKEIDFKKACDSVLMGFSRKNYNIVNSYINKTYGLYLKFRSGVYDRYENKKKINSTQRFGNLSPAILDWMQVSKADLNKLSLVYGKLPSYNCDNSSWSKRGYTADSLKKYNPISEIVTFEIKYEELKISKKDLYAIKYVEQNSRKIIFTGSKGDGAIFYMIYIEGKWYLSVIDQSVTDCSA